MEKMDSLQIREVKQSIETFLNKQEIPLEVQRMLLKELLADTEKKTDEELIRLLNERNLKEQEGK